MARPEYKRRWDRENILRVGSPPAGRPPPVSSRKVAEMRRLRSEGQRVVDIANETGLHYVTVVKYTKDIPRGAQR